MKPYETSLPKVRMGRCGDGGYVIVDNGLSEYTSLVTMGICDDNSFEVEFNKMSNAYIQQYDGTIESPPVHIENSSFYKKMMYAGSDLVYDERLGNKRFLKIDIEGSEWKLLPTMDLTPYEQIVMELHEPTHECIESLRHLIKNHTIVHVHGNSCNMRPLYYLNAKGLLSWMPCCMEVTLLRNDIGMFGKNKTRYPTQLDFSCDTRPDWDLDMYPFSPC